MNKKGGMYHHAPSVPFYGLHIGHNGGVQPEIRMNDNGFGYTPSLSVDKLSIKESVPFYFKRDSITKVTIFRGSDERIAELTKSDDLNALANILHNSPSFSGDSTADLNYTIIIDSLDGSKLELIVTGTGTVFIDQTSKHAYTLNTGEFIKFLAERS